MSDTAIKVENISKIYKLYNKPIDRLKESLSIKKTKFHKEYYALQDISFEVKKGETVGIIGTNGAGKSTLLKIITGVLNQSSGNVEVNGKISALLELGAGFNPEYTGVENIYLNGTMVGYTKEEIDKKIGNIENFADIGDFINQPVKIYSSGMFARLAFAVAINIEPDILIVDEALSVGDIAFQSKCFRKFDELKQKGITILFVSHDINSVKQMCSRVLWIESGRQKMFDSKEEVCAAYIDEQRIKTNTNVSKDVNSTNKLELLKANYNNGKRYYPAVKNKMDRFNSEEVKIEACFLSNDDGEIENELEVNKLYVMHIVIKLLKDLDNLIVGVSIENSKGLPIFGINNYIAENKVLDGSKNEILEICYRFKLPKLMKGSYTLNPAVARGTQSEHVMLTWLHAANLIYINNNGYNDSLIEIDSDVKVYKHIEKEIVIFCDK